MIVSGLLLAFVTPVYLFRPDFAAAVTVFPVWMWALPGLLAVLPWSLQRQPRSDRFARAAALLWLIYVLTLAEEPRSLLRSLLPSRPGTDAIRVVSLNCAGGDPVAAAEVAAYLPDIVLLQEAPPRARVEELGRRLYGDGAGIVAAIDPAILVRGTVEPIPLPRELRGSFAAGRATLTSGQRIDVVSLRLSPALFRMDLWSPDCWRAQAENRRLRRAELKALSAALASRDASVPLIIGGDFNVPQGDSVLEELPAGMRDSFAVAGTGWGNTIVNEFPLLRIDQVWVSRHFTARRVLSRRTIHSDHRMVVCDLEMSPRE